MNAADLQRLALEFFLVSIPLACVFVAVGLLGFAWLVTLAPVVPAGDLVWARLTSPDLWTMTTGWTQLSSVAFAVSTGTTVVNSDKALDLLPEERDRNSSQLSVTVQ